MQRPRILAVVGALCAVSCNANGSGAKSLPRQQQTLVRRHYRTANVKPSD